MYIFMHVEQFAIYLFPSRIEHFFLSLRIENREISEFQKKN